MELLKVIQERRSIRRYKTEEIPEEILMEVFEAARRAPSWANTQPWRFIIVKDKAIKTALSDTLTPNNPARQAILEAPVAIVIVAKKGVSGFFGGKPATDKGDWFMFDAGIVMEHIALAAWNFGLGTCHVGAFDAKKVEELLKVPEGFAVVEMTPLGYFDVTPKVTPRRPLEELIYIDHFGVPYKG